MKTNPSEAIRLTLNNFPDDITRPTEICYSIAPSQNDDSFPVGFCVLYASWLAGGKNQKVGLNLIKQCPFVSYLSPTLCLYQAIHVFLPFYRMLNSAQCFVCFLVFPEAKNV